MFIKIVRGVHEAVYECTRYRKYPRQDSGPGINISDITLEMEGTPDQAIVVHVSVYDCDVFVMNHEGKTIDAWRALPAPQPGLPVPMLPVPMPIQESRR